VVAEDVVTALLLLLLLGPQSEHCPVPAEAAPTAHFQMTRDPPPAAEHVQGGTV
jgi:hypothetical protein